MLSFGSGSQSHPELTFERTHDLARVRGFFRDPRVYDAAAGDDAPAFSRFSPHPDPRIWYVIASDERGAIALYTLVPASAVLWQVHASHAFGGRRVAALRAVPRWFFARSGCRRLIAEIPATNAIAIRHARQAGFVEYGRNPHAYQKRGELVDLVLLGVSA